LKIKIVKSSTSLLSRKITPEFKMKLSTINWLSAMIALPLFMGILNLAPAGAEQIDRSRRTTVDQLPSVTDLNLVVPVAASPLPSDRAEPENSIEPVWSNPTPVRRNSSTTRERTNRSKPSKQGVTLATNSNFSTSFAGEQSHQINSGTKRKNSTVKNTSALQESTPRDNRKSRSSSRKEIAAVSRPPLSGNYLRLVRDPNQGYNNVGNPLYTLEAYVRGEKYQTFTAVSGTARSQTFDRNRGSNSAPLPDGLYSVSSQVAAGTAYEVGRTFIGIYPEFKTARVDLGIHLDRSFNQTNGYDGTAGCIGIATVAERDAINDFVAKYRPRSLFVKIAE
jgi:hypothetical protein